MKQKILLFICCIFVLCNFIEYETINRTLMLVLGSSQFIVNLHACIYIYMDNDILSRETKAMHLHV